MASGSGKTNALSKDAHSIVKGKESLCMVKAGVGLEDDITL